MCTTEYDLHQFDRKKEIQKERERHRGRKEAVRQEGGEGGREEGMKDVRELVLPRRTTGKKQ